MKKIPDKYLPIGTVVMLKGGTKRLMISGFCAMENEPAENEETKIWDYSGCLYPEGFLSSNQCCLFDHEQIEEIFHLGLSAEEDEEEKDFKKQLKKAVKNLNKTSEDN